MEESKRDEIVIVDKRKNVKSEDYGFPFRKRVTQYGLATGLIMSAVSIVISAIAGTDNIGWDFLKYLVLAFALGRLLKEYKTYLPAGKVFKDGLVLGMYTSFVVAITMTAVNLIVGLIGLEYGFLQKYGMEADSFGHTLLINGLMIFECVVFGMILTFIWLQLLKDAKPAE